MAMPVWEEDGLETTWQPECRNYWKEIASTPDYPSYLVVSYRHYAHLRDAHVCMMNSVNRPGALLVGHYLPIYYPNFVVSLIENQLCICGSNDSSCECTS